VQSSCAGRRRTISWSGADRRQGQKNGNGAVQPQHEVDIASIDVRIRLSHI
jgi:hypothetical protein